MITTRAASDSHLGEEVADQLLARSKPLAIAAGTLVMLALIPGLPKFAFIIVAAGLGAAAYANRAVAERAGAATGAAVPVPDSICSPLLACGSLTFRLD